VEIILASESPRRKMLLEQIGLEFNTRVPDIDEKSITGTPNEIVKKLAGMKAFSIFEENKENCIIAADTIVSFENNILYKPESEDEAYDMLKFLSGKVHSVFTGICIINNKSLRQEIYSDIEETKVYFNKLTDKEIINYIKSKEPMDKAGAYGIQGRGAVFVKKIEGDYFNVVGLPLSKVYNILKEFIY